MAANILRIDASIRKNESYSRTLTDKVISQLNKTHKSKVTVRDLSEGIPFIDEEWGEANFTAINERTSDQQACLLKSDLYVDELANADLIVIGLPIYNFGLPAVFKAWVDQIVRSKLTFRYTEQGSIGLLKNKKAYIVIASGGTQLDTELDFVSAYLRHTFGFIGITDITFIDSSGLGNGETTVLSRCHALIEQL